MEKLGKGLEAVFNDYKEEEVNLQMKLLEEKSKLERIMNGIANIEDGYIVCEYGFGKARVRIIKSNDCVTAKIILNKYLY